MRRCRVIRMAVTAVVLLVVAPVAVLGVVVRPDVVAALVVVGSLISGTVASMGSGGAAAEAPHRSVTPGSGRAGSLRAEPRRIEGARERRQRQPVTATVSEVVMGSATVVGLVVIAGSASAPILIVMALIASVVSWMGMRGGHVAPTSPADKRPFALPALNDVPVPRLCRLWRASGQQLSSTADPSRRARLGAARQDLLDEFERRDPASFALFLAAPDCMNDDIGRFFGHTDDVGRRDT